jgi:hypothetical protein
VLATCPRTQGYRKEPSFPHGTPEVGLKKSGIINDFYQSGKGHNYRINGKEHKRKGAETERGLKERGIIHFVPNRIGAQRKVA